MPYDTHRWQSSRPHKLAQCPVHVAPEGGVFATLKSGELTNEFNEIGSEFISLIMMRMLE